MILIGAGIPLIVSLLLAVSARAVARRLPPATAVRVLVGAAVVVAAATGFVLAVVAFTVASTDRQVAMLGDWSAPVVARLAAIPTTVGIGAGVLLSVLMTSTLWRVVRASHALRVAYAAGRDLGDAVDGLVVLDDDRPRAYALPGRKGRIIITRGMIGALDAAERRVLIAHERSHLLRRHALFIQLAEIAAAADPLLLPVASAVREGVERWADEDAAALVGDRRLTARAVARAAVAATTFARSRSGSSLALSIAGASTSIRTQALLAPAPRPHRALAAAVLAGALAASMGALVVGHSADYTFDRASISLTR